MAKRSKKNNSGWNVLKFFIIAGILVFILAMFSSRLIDFLTTAELFKIRTVVIDPSLKGMNINSISLDKLKGRNIFKVNLGAVQKELRYKYPSIDQLRLIRHFPDKIDVVAAHREPFAFLDHDGRRTIIDRNGIVVAGTLLPNLKLPVITGIRLRDEAVVGRLLGQREINVALSIIRAIKTNEDLNTYSVVVMDVSNLSNINFQLSNQMKIIIDDDKIYPKIRKLGVLLAHSDIDLKDYRYIDLRFDEPVLGKNDQTN